MRKLTWPTTQRGWEELAADIVKANLKLAHMSYVDLERELKTIGVTDHHKNISGKLSRGRFSAAYFLQVLACAGVDELQLPKTAIGHRAD